MVYFNVLKSGIDNKKETHQVNIIVLIDNGKPIRMNIITVDINKAWDSAKHTVNELSSKYIQDSAEALLFRNATAPRIKVFYESGDVHNLELNADEIYKGAKKQL